jgi:hypothetical protein
MSGIVTWFYLTIWSRPASGSAGRSASPILLALCQHTPDRRLKKIIMKTMLVRIDKMRKTKDKTATVGITAPPLVRGKAEAIFGHIAEP